MFNLGVLLFLTQWTYAVCTARDPISYHKYRIYKVESFDESLPFFPAPQHGKWDFRILNQHRRRDTCGRTLTTSTYLIPPNKEEYFVKIIKSRKNEKFNFTLVADDLGESIKQEKQGQSILRSESGFHQVYHSYKEILNFVNSFGDLKNKAGEAIAKVERVGKTTQNRDVVLVKISSNHSAEKPIAFLEAGMHAREWLSVASSLYMIDQLVRNYTYNMGVLENIDFYLVPVSNPDGYEFSRNHDRLWRKTRSRHGRFWGVDGNRNFDFHWNGTGASDFPGSQTYRGPKPFSEPETRSIRDAGKKFSKRIKLFVSLHCYGPYILYPWSYKRVANPPQLEIMDAMAKEAAQAIANFGGTNYTVGMSSELLYDSPGGSDDYFKGVLGVDLAFTIEISGAGENTFIILPSKIIKIAGELYEGIKVLAKRAAAYKPTRTSNLQGN